jgi:hypothetical protein
MGCICVGDYVLEWLLFNASSLERDEYEVLLRTLLILVHW